MSSGTTPPFAKSRVLKEQGGSKLIDPSLVHLIDDDPGKQGPMLFTLDRVLLSPPVLTVKALLLVLVCVGQWHWLRSPNSTRRRFHLFQRIPFRGCSNLCGVAATTNRRFHHRQHPSASCSCDIVRDAIVESIIKASEMTESHTALSVPFDDNLQGSAARRDAARTSRNSKDPFQRHTQNTGGNVELAAAVVADDTDRIPQSLESGGLGLVAHESHSPHQTNRDMFPPSVALRDIISPRHPSQPSVSRRWRVPRPRCNYPNGLWTVLFAQVLLFLSNIMSLNSYWSCDLVRIEGNLEAIFLNATRASTLTSMALIPDDDGADDDDDALADLFNANKNSTFAPRGVGLWSWKGPDGNCVWGQNEWESEYYDDVGYVTYHDLYEGFDKFTSSWGWIRKFAEASTWVGWFLIVWLLAFSCVPFRIWMRKVLGLVLIIALASLQSPMLSLDFTVLCQRYECKAGESMIVGVAASVLVTIAGITLILANNERHYEMQRQRNRTDSSDETSRDGLNSAEEVPVESELIDLSLIDPMAATEVDRRESPRES